MADFSGIAQFEPHHEPSSVAIRWADWLVRFKRSMIAFDIKGPARQKALLLYLAGPEVERIFSTLSAVGDEDDYDTTEAKLTAHFSPKKNLLYERHVFRQASQANDETIDQFYTRLRHLSLTCGFNNADEEIKTQLVERCQSSRLRRKAFRDDPKLDELIAYARAIEISDHHTREVEKSTKRDTETLNYQREEKRRDFKPNPKAQICYRCGGTYPHKDKPCPAKQKSVTNVSEWDILRKCAKEKNLNHVNSRKKSIQ